MFRSRRLILALLLVAACPGWSYAQTRVAPFYRLPADGAWVKYEWQRTAEGQKEEKGTLRISSVGEKEVGGKRCRWVEIDVESGAGDKKKRQLRKLLVAEKAFRDGQPLPDCVVECYHQDDAGRVVTRLSGKRLDDFLSMGLGDMAPLREIRAEEELVSKLGKYVARHVSTTGKSGETTREYHAWLTKDVPFGVVKLTVREEGGAAARVFTAVATESGRDAKSRLDESRAK